MGSQPQTVVDIDRIYNEEGVRAILNLQQDKDIEYWGIDINPITKRCEELGIVYMRNPVSPDPSISIIQCVCIQICTYTHGGLHIHTHIHIHIHMHLCLRECVCVYVYVCVESGV